MVGRALLSRAEPGFTLPAFERIAPPPPPELIRARLEQGSAPGDVVADLFGRGGWVARAAIDRQRRAFDLESSPLTRLLAEVVLRPPDLRHLDAAFSSLAASPLGESSLRLAINELFGTRCQTCGRALPIDELEWAADRPERVHYRCVICRDQQGRHEHQAVDPTDADRDRARRDVGAATARERLLERFPLPPGGEGLAQALLDLHTDRQLVGLAAILARIEGDLRAAPVESALRLAFLHAVLPASRLGLGGSKIPALRMSGGTVRVPAAERWHERNPWLAFEDGFRMVRGFVQRLESNALGPLEARFGTDLRALGEGVSTAVVRVLTPSALRTLAEEGRGGHGPRIRLVLGQPPARFNQERLAATYHATCWVLGREAASLLPIEALLSPAVQPPWSWQSAALRRALEAAAPHLARDGRVVLLLEHGGPEALVAAVLGGVGAGYRIAEARLADPDEEAGGVVELIPPVGVLPPGPRTRANRTLEPGPGDRGDPEIVPVPGLFAPPERIEARPFSAREAAATVLETTVEVLRARGEPAHFERLLGEMLVGLDRSGALRRLLASEQGPAAAAGTGPAGADRAQALDQGDRADHPEGGWPRRESDSPRHAAGGAEAAADASGAGSPPVTRTRIFEEPQPTSDPVERVLALIRDELARPTQHRLVEVEPGRWWLGERRDREAAAIPLADRVEWAVYSLLSTAGPIAESAFYERVAALFTGHDLPDEALVRAALESYRSPASTSARLMTHEDLRRRTAEHAELLAHLANGGHRLGMHVWIGRRDQARRVGGRALAEYLDPAREREPWFPTISLVPKEDGEAVDCIWYQRGGTALLWEVEWTAMLGDVLLRRHARIPPDERLIRFLAIPPERRELARHKLEASPVLRDALESGNWHLILWPHLRAWLARDPLELADLEPYLNLEPPIERRAEQLPLF